MNDKNTQVSLEVTLRDKISDRIRSSFVELIPEEAWKAMVQKEINTFRTVGLPNLIKEELKERLSKVLKEELNKPEYQGYWDIGNGQKPSEAVIEITKQLTPDLITAMWGSVIQRCVDELRNNLTTLSNQY